VRLEGLCTLKKSTSSGTRTSDLPACNIVPQPATLKWAHNIKVGLGWTGWAVMDWFHLALDRNQWMVLVNTVMNPRVPQNAGKFSRTRLYRVS
jgi:hypothetical protein